MPYVTLFILIMVMGSRVGIACTTPLRLLFEPADFPESELWRRDNIPGPFPAWAANAATRVAERIRAGNAVVEVFHVVAQMRQALAFQTVGNNVEGQLFGLLKREEDELQHHLTSPLVSLVPDKGRSLAPFEQEIGALAQPVISVPPTNLVDERMFYYRTQTYFAHDHRPIPTTTLYVSSSFLLVEHPKIKNSLEVFQDIQHRLEWVRKNPHPPEMAMAEFLSAMFGYYNAIPYRRGSSAIARVFFQGFFLGVFGRKLPPLPDGMDVRAMIMDQPTFVAAFLPLLRKL